MLCQSQTNHRRITAERKLTEYQDQIHDIGMDFLVVAEENIETTGN